MAVPNMNTVRSKQQHSSLIAGLIAVGGWEALEARYNAAAPPESYLNPESTCGRPDPNAFNTFRSLDSGYPWFGTFGRTTLGGLWYWCANQVIQ